MKTTRVLLTIAAVAAMAPAANAAFIVEASAGLATATNFSLGGGTTTVSTSIDSFAVGLTTPASASVFGGNGSPDTYIFSYSPGLNPANADNFSPAPGSLLGSTTGFGSETASGLVGGVSGNYKVYITAPSSANVDPDGSTITVTGDGPPVIIPLFNFNDGGSGPDVDPGPAFVGGANNAWALLGTVALTAGQTYTVSVAANDSAAFVSQRVHGVMWELQPGTPPVPEPSTIGIAALAMLSGLAVVRRKR